MQTDVTVLSLSGNDPVSKNIAETLNAVHTSAVVHQFPDGETRICLKPEKIKKQAIVVCSLYHPNQVVLPLLFLAETLRDYGAEKILLVAPYLAYMRQDQSFKNGEGISAKYFARLISNYFDGLITVDPHLHRIKSLDEIYAIPTQVIHAAPLVADWIRHNIEKPLLVGPDSESEQWVEDLARRSEAPFVILEKVRHGDRDVEVSIPEVEKWLQHTPVLFDDIISTGKTMIETIRHLKHSGLSEPVCIGVHGIFADNAYQDLLTVGAGKVITTNTIIHPSNGIDVIQAIVETVHGLI